MKQIFELHPVALAGRLVAGNLDNGPAQRDAEPEPDTARTGLRERLAARLALRRRAAASPARSGNV